jgi:hypothetical protein
MISVKILTVSSLLVMLSPTLLVTPETGAQQWCQGAYDQKSGSNFSSTCRPLPPLYERLGGRHGIAVVVGD